jgi:hypothetical protein
MAEIPTSLAPIMDKDVKLRLRSGLVKIDVNGERSPVENVLGTGE